MKNQILRTVNRFYGSKLVNRGGRDCRGNGRFLTITRHKTNIAMLDDENKYSEVEIASEESVSNLSWLHKCAPGYPANGSKITVIHDPSDFYSTLINKCRTAQRRITLASLYLGTGELEADLVSAIEKNLQRTSGTRVKILLDYMRGSRGKKNSRTMLEPLLETRWTNRCDISLYHTPKLRGFLKAVIPDRFNELIGLQHMKLYLFDDTLVISGANLSNDYFTNRQDRYIIIEDCKELCDFYDKLVDSVGEFSFKLMPDGSATFNPDSKYHPHKGAGKDFTDAAAARIKALFQEEIERRLEAAKNDRLAEHVDTWIFPLIEMGQLNVKNDSKVTLRLFQTASPGSTLRLATGYFNLTPAYKNALIKDCKATCDLLTAHPTTNGFFGAKGVAGSIPKAYTKIEESFCKMCERMGQNHRVNLWEFYRSGWTYHAKGLWYTLPGQRRPCLTLIGSPNFGYRSVRKDLETQVAVVTRNEELQKALETEYQRLFSRAKPVDRMSFRDRDRIVPTWVCAAVVLFRYFF